jgi:hypothetical protein
MEYIRSPSLSLREDKELLGPGLKLLFFLLWIGAILAASIFNAVNDPVLPMAL